MSTTVVSEEWRSVVGWEGLYEVSNTGHVRSLERDIKFADGRVRRFPSVVLKPNMVGTRLDYRQVHLTKNCERRPISIHRLVADAFLAPPPTPSHIVLHNRGAAAGDGVDNLRWGTHAENTADSLRDGTFCLGEQQHNAKLTAASVAAIRQEAAAGGRNGTIARKYGVCPASITSIVKRKTWKHIT